MAINFIRTNTGIYPYNRKAAVNYAKKWAFDRNPKYYDFSNIGGDCTNFSSQVIYSGGCPMNVTKTLGWYYYNTNNRSPSWTGVEYLYRFLTTNKGRGPIAVESTIDDIDIGDIVQLNFGADKQYDHSLVVIKIKEPRKPENVYISTHTYDRFDYPISNYYYDDIRFIHILGYKN